MSTLAEIEAAVQTLPLDERAQLIEWLDEHRNELLPGGDAEGAHITEAQRREVLRRRDELLANPSLGEPIDDGYFARLRQRVADVGAD
jgi:hypothetical protein